MTRRLITLALAVAALSAANGPAEAVLGMRLYYDDRHRGYVAAPEAADPAPGVLLVHDWSGLDGGELVMARAWAEAGYAVLAIDLFEGETFESRAASGPITRALLSPGSRREVARNLRAGLKFLTEMDGVDASRIAVVGYEFGGAMSIYAATAELGLQAAIAYEAPAAGYAAAGPVAAPLLLLTAAPPPEAAEALVAGQTSDGRSAVVAYPGAEPGFATGSGPSGQAAFDRGVDFLKAVLGDTAQ